MKGFCNFFNNDRMTKKYSRGFLNLVGDILSGKVERLKAIDIIVPYLTTLLEIV